MVLPADLCCDSFHFLRIAQVIQKDAGLHGSGKCIAHPSLDVDILHQVHQGVGDMGDGGYDRSILILHGFQDLLQAFFLPGG